ncbi:unnamed protein product, partial [Mesorhabditis spiculigera]
MSGGMYAGDEVGAIVFDAGSHSFRCGFAGEEFPTSDISSSIGVDEAVAMETDDTSITKRERKIYIGTTKNIVPRANCEIKNFMSDGMIEDWDLFEEMMNYAYKDALRTDSSDHPALFSESAWNDKAKREKLTELAFEKYNVPAYFLVNNAVLAAFANGRTSGLIVDSGATQTSAVPVFDGYAVKHAIVRCPLGGDMISEQIEKAKEEVNEGEPAKWTEKANLPAVTESYDKFMRKLLLQDMAASVLQLCDVPIDPESAEKLPSSPYAFPNGFHKYLRDVDTSSLMNVSHLAWSSCGMCDVDMRPSMYQNVLVTGGNSLILGFTERLSHDLSQKCPPSARIRLSAPPTSMERRFGPWIGGSILASVGTFQQMWISKTEYEESGRSIVDKKCP